jgi:erythritol kinase
MSKSIMALDVGTSMIKAVLISAEGETLFSASMPVEDHGVHAVDPGEIWRQVASTISQVVVKAGSSADIDSLIATGQGDGLWTLENGAETPTSVMLWNSTQPSSVIRDWELDGTIDLHFDATGTVLWPGCSAALWRWFVGVEPERAAAVTTIFTAKDFINFKLTGVIATDITDATIPFVDPVSKEYSSEAFNRLGCQDMFPLVPRIIPAGSKIGNISAAAALLTGLSESTVVYMGLLDVAAMVMGSGLSQSGDVLGILGTTAASISIVPPGKQDDNPVGATIYLPNGNHLRVMGSTSGTATLEWFLRTHGFDGPGRYESFWQEVEAAKPGGEVFLPYLNGERAPFLATNACGVLLGISSTTTRGAIGRAVVEGVTMSLRHGMEVAATAKGTGAITLAGGGSSSSRWAQLVSNVVGRPVSVNGRSDLGAFGVASLLLSSPSYRPSISSVVDKYFEPDQDVDLWQAKYLRFLHYVELFKHQWLQDSSQVSPTQQR